jgi:hypothetical protein
MPWLMALSLFGVGVLWCVKAKPAFLRAWDEVNAEIEDGIRRTAS